MKLFGKGKDKTKQAKGKLKERVGEETGDEGLKASGKRDQFVGEAKETGREAMDRAAGAAEDAKRRLKGEGEGREERTGEDENPDEHRH